MPPRKAAPAEEDDQCPSLKLTMEKGPLSGQTNNFKSGSRIQIGRVARGNTLSIKDPGISTKHLIIQTEPVTGGRRHWTVTDLDSSNGTFLNGERLGTLSPSALSDGDVIIIGEQTSIRVNFEDNAGASEVRTTNVRRNARRGVSKQVVEELGIIDEDTELGLGIKKNVDLGKDCGKSGAAGQEIAKGRRTRGSKAKELEKGSLEEFESVGKVSLTMTRKDTKGEKSENLVIDLDDAEEEKNDEVAEVEGKQGRNVGIRGTRSAKNNKNLLNELNVDVKRDLEPSGVKITERVGVRRTRSSRKEENIDEPLIDLSVIEGKRRRNGTRGRKNLPVERPLEVKETEESNLEEQKVCEEEEEEEQKVCEEEEEQKVCQEEEKNVSESGVKEGGVEAGNGELVADLEKMTIVEYLDFLDVYLPKQIIDETEKMITEMRQEAKRVHEYVLRKKKAMEKSDDVAMEEKFG